LKITLFFLTTKPELYTGRNLKKLFKRSLFGVEFGGNNKGIGQYPLFGEYLRDVLLSSKPVQYTGKLRLPKSGRSYDADKVTARLEKRLNTSCSGFLRKTLRIYFSNLASPLPNENGVVR
jgi:hypothetical protein